jgi:hypothetical protein
MSGNPAILSKDSSTQNQSIYFISVQVMFSFVGHTTCTTFSRARMYSIERWVVSRMMNWQEFERNLLWYIRGTALVFSKRQWGKPREMWVMRGGVPAEVRVNKYGSVSVTITTSRALVTSEYKLNDNMHSARQQVKWQVTGIKYLGIPQERRKDTVFNASNSLTTRNNGD